MPPRSSCDAAYRFGSEKVYRMRQMPLFVDLDGTLIRTDMLYESFLGRLRHDLLIPFKALIWLPAGKAALKSRIAEGFEFAPELLPYNASVISHIRAARDEGRLVYLATASHKSIAERIAAHLGLFDGVIASDAHENMAGRSKLEAIVALAQGVPFEYVGNSTADIPVWEKAATVTAVAPDAAASRWLQSQPGPPHVLPVDPLPSAPRAAIKALRLHQWLKNLLIFLPVVAAHKLFSPAALVASAVAFIAFGLCASAVYLINDMVDLAADRNHLKKRNRPFASGALPLSFGFSLAPVLFLVAFAIGLLLPPQFVAMLLAYVAITFAYSFVLKRKLAIDVLALAGLYTMRILAGAAAIAVVPSFWLLAFSMFIFFGLALMKRFAELSAAGAQGKTAAAGRNYQVADMPVVMATGIASCFMCVLVLALYINSPDVAKLYRHPSWIWLLCPLLLYWITRVWALAQRGLMDEDPVVFAARDRVSLVLAGIGAVIVVLSTRGF